MKYLKIFLDKDYFIFGVIGLGSEEILNLRKQSLERGFSFDDSSEEEYNNISENEKDKMEELFEDWNSKINWNLI